MREGRHFKTAEAKRHTFADLVDRYLKEVLPARPRNAANTLRHLQFWRQKLGPLPLSDITPALLVRHRNELLAETTRRNKPRSGATVVRYLASISHAFTVAMKDWQWVTDNPVSKISKPRQGRGRNATCPMTSGSACWRPATPPPTATSSPWSFWPSPPACVAVKS